MDRKVLNAVLAARRTRTAIIVLRDLTTREDRLIYREDSLDQEPESVRSAVNSAFRTGKSGQFVSEGRSLFLQTHVPAPRLVIIGAVHIAQSLSVMAQGVGIDVSIIDPRTAFATGERFPGQVLHAEWPDDVIANDPLDAYTALAAVTHDPKIDDPGLKAALDANCFYIGALGSRKTHAARLTRLTEMGYQTADLDRIHAPIGLDIGAASPSEIAVAVLAEIIQALRKPAAAQ